MGSDQTAAGVQGRRAGLVEGRRRGNVGQVMTTALWPSRRGALGAQVPAGLGRSWGPVREVHGRGRIGRWGGPAAQMAWQG